MVKIKKIWDKWKKLSQKIIVFQSKILLALIYFIFVSPIAIMMKIFSDPLKLKGRPQWFVREKEDPVIEKLREQ